MNKPEPDYTKNIRANLKRWKPALDKISDCRVKSVLAWLEEVCFRYDYLVKRNAKLQKQSELLTLGLLQEKDKNKNLEVACKLAQHELLEITTDSYALAAIKQALK